MHGGYGRPPSGGRLPDATRLGTVRLRVSDLDRSLAFYEEALGFRATRRDEAAAALAAAGAEIQRDGPVVTTRDPWGVGTRGTTP